MISDEDILKFMQSVELMQQSLHVQYNKNVHFVYDNREMQELAEKMHDICCYPDGHDSEKCGWKWENAIKEREKDINIWEHQEHADWYIKTVIAIDKYGIERVKGFIEKQLENK